MARNRPTQDRDLKRAEIVDAAAELFVRDGYDATSMSALAKRAGVTPNTIYWYFDDKDAVLVAVVSQITRAAQAEYAERDLPTLADRLLWLVGVFERLDSLTVTIHARAGVAPAVAAWHTRFHEASDAWFTAEMHAHLERGGRTVPSDAELATTARLWTYAIEGLVAHESSAASRRELCELLVAQLEASAAAIHH